ncbi:MAG: glycoside hydrolase family 3 C-terminal domain-containing protein [Candidatus Coatesbacteria bacterium]
MSIGSGAVRPLASAVFVAAALNGVALGMAPAWRDPAQPIDRRVADLVARMTVEEKIAQMGTDAPAIPRLGVPAYNWAGECVHGIVAEGASIFPQAIALGASWDPDLVHAAAEAMGDEARVLHRRGRTGLTFFSPVLNLARDPRWGRVQESYGEDPLLAGRLGAAFVRGLQGGDRARPKALAIVKHLAVYSDEIHRHTGSATVSEDTLRRYYLPQFAAAIRDAGAGGVMCAYNAVNGTPCCASEKLLTGVLRDEWKFDGFVVSDCGAIDDLVGGHGWRSNLPEAAGTAVKAGCDLDCGTTFAKALPVALRREYISPADFDRAVGRLMRARFRLGLFDPPERSPFRSIPDGAVDSPAHRALALRAAREGQVLLANPGGMLPFPATLTSVAVIGPSAAVKRLGDYSGWFTRVVTPLAGLRAVLPPSVTIRHARGCEISRRTPVSAESFTTDPSRPGRRGVFAEWFANGDLAGAPVSRREAVVGFSRSRDGLPVTPGRDGISARWKCWIVPPATRTYRLSVTAPGRVRMWFDGKRVVDQWMERPPTTDTATVAMQAGIPRRLDLEWASADPDAGLEFGWDVEPDRALLEEAVAAARASDAVVLVVGTDRYTENEGGDRETLDLPGDQAMLIRAVVEANPRTVVVLECGGPVNLDWAASGAPPAVLQAWFPGEEGGTAIAEVLTGKVNPSGRLPLTWYESADDLPPMEDYEPAHGRTYMHAKAPVRFPFGFGLSYTEFTYANLRVSPVPLPAGSPLTAEADITNSGVRDGDEVVQAYVSAPGPGRPVRALADFARVSLKPGETKTVTLTVPAAALDVPGTWHLMVGPDSSTGLVESFEVSPAR